MKQSPTTQAVAAAAVSLLVFVFCVGAFVPPFVDHTISSIPTTIAFGIAIAVSFVLHVAFVAIAAHRAGRSAALWAVLTVIFFPIGSIAGLILFEWFNEQGSQGGTDRAA